MNNSNTNHRQERPQASRNGHQAVAEIVDSMETPTEELDGLVRGAASVSALSSPSSSEDGSLPETATESSAEAQLNAVWQRLGLPKREWPVEAERSSERRKYKQTMAVELLASGMTVTEVARQLGADPSTVHRWLNDPFFAAELEARRDEIIESMLDQHLLASRMATAKLMELMDSDNEQVALRAAAVLYAGGQRAYQFMDVRKRIEKLEDHMGIAYGFKV
jgi:transposase-like protein